MSRKISPVLLLVLVLFCGLVCAAERLREITDPNVAVQDSDFAIQGEYAGKGIWSSGEEVAVGAQVVALGHGRFDVTVTHGGLPGNGWRRGDQKFTLAGERNGDTTSLTGPGVSGQIEDGHMTVSGKNGKLRLALDKTIRHSPTEGAKPPQDAVVLFDGTTAEHFTEGKMSADHNLMAQAESKQKFGDYTLHIEFRLSYMPEALGQARSNSGLYLHNCYEVQVLDSFGLDGKHNECGGIYQLRDPDVNMCFPPLTWQTYDVDFIAPKYKDGQKVSDAKITVRHNGVLIQQDLTLPQATPGREKEGPAPRPFFLQGHGNNVRYRNIWLIPKP